MKKALILLAFILCVGTTALAADPQTFWVRYDKSVMPSASFIQLQYVLNADAAGNVTGNPVGTGWDEIRTCKITGWFVIPAGVAGLTGGVPANNFTIHLGTVNDPTLDLLYGFADKCANDKTTMSPPGYAVNMFNAKLLPRASGMGAGTRAVLRVDLEK